MAAITASAVKDLRERTGAGMMDCKRALVECGGDSGAATDWIRKKGLANADKKADRTTAQGLVAISLGERSASIIELNCETDFVAKNEKFYLLATNLSKMALELGNQDIETLLKSQYPGSNNTTQEAITDMIAMIGENISFKRVSLVTVERGVIGSYMHGAIDSNIGKIGVLVALESEADPAKLAALGKDIAIHIAASKPLALTTAELNPKFIEKEAIIFREEAIGSGTPAAVADKMVPERLAKLYEEVVLMEQYFVKDSKKKIAWLITQAEQELGARISVSKVIRFAAGEEDSTYSIL